MMRESPILFPYYLISFWGRVSLQYCKRKYSFCDLPMILVFFFTLDEIMFRVSDSELGTIALWAIFKSTAAVLNMFCLLILTCRGV